MALWDNLEMVIRLLDGGADMDIKNDVRKSFVME